MKENEPNSKMQCHLDALQQGNIKHRVIFANQKYNLSHFPLKEPYLPSLIGSGTTSGAEILARLQWTVWIIITQTL